MRATGEGAKSEVRHVCTRARVPMRAQRLYGSCPYHTIPTSIFALIRWVSAPSEALIRQETDHTKNQNYERGMRLSMAMPPAHSWVCETAARPQGHHC